MFIIEPVVQNAARVRFLIDPQYLNHIRTLNANDEISTNSFKSWMRIATLEFGRTGKLFCLYLYLFTTNICPDIMLSVKALYWGNWH